MNPSTEYLSKHLTVQAATICRPGFNNAPTTIQIKALKYWGEHIYDPICEHFGFNVFNHSVFRNDDYNAAIGGDPNSDHMCHTKNGITPAAGDPDMDGTKFTNKILFDWAVRNLQFKEIIWEKGTTENPDWVHIANAYGDNRMIVRRCLVMDGHTKYIPFDLYKFPT